MALCCRRLLDSLQHCLPAAGVCLNTAAEREKLCIRRILSVVMAREFSQRLGLRTDWSIPREFFSVQHCDRLKESPLAHLLRNYYQLMPAEPGLRSAQLEAQLTAAYPEMLPLLMMMPAAVMRGILQRPDNDHTSEMQLRVELAQQGNLVREYCQAQNPQSLLTRQLTRAVQTAECERRELRRLENLMQNVQISFSTESNAKAQLVLRPQSSYRVTENRLLEMQLFSPTDGEHRTVMFAHDSQNGCWRSAHVTSRKTNAYIPHIDLRAMICSASPVAIV